MATSLPLPLRDVVIDDAFWSDRIETARKVSIDYMWDALNDRIPDIPPSGAIQNFRIAAGLDEGDFVGFRFQDSDLYKWLEAVAYSLETTPDDALRLRADEAIELIAAAQMEDGYIDTHIQLGKMIRFSDTCRSHEMYCAGHMMEAAVAYHKATGSDILLKVACRFADCIDRAFGPEADKIPSYPGHQEIELGLYKLYHATGERRYLRLAEYFLNERGRQPYYYDKEQENRIARGEAPIDYFRNHGFEPFSYQQAHKPVREQTEAVGHAVRCVYMCAGMADVGGESDHTLLEAAKTLYDNIVHTQMYVTGGIGSMGDGEAFTFPYDLPNDTMYNETCASVGLMMVSQRLLNIEHNAAYADVLERALYNNLLAGVALDGRSFFYVNPMEVWPERSNRRHDIRDVKPVRQGWYGCACCPPNVLRTLLGLGQYIYSTSHNELFVNLFISSTATFEVDGQRVSVRQQGNYPWEGTINFDVDCAQSVKLAINIRLPQWCTAPVLKLNGKPLEISAICRNGYAVVDGLFTKGDRLTLELPMAPMFLYCDDRVPFNAGKVALQRGPLVYCAEQQDNGEALWNLAVDTSCPAVEQQEEILGGVVTLTTQGVRRNLRSHELCTTSQPSFDATAVKFVPYYAWCNREPGEMSVWQRIK